MRYEIYESKARCPVYVYWWMVDNTACLKVWNTRKRACWSSREGLQYPLVSSAPWLAGESPNWLEVFLGGKWLPAGAVWLMTPEGSYGKYTIYTGDVPIITSIYNHGNIWFSSQLRSEWKQMMKGWLVSGSNQLCGMFVDPWTWENHNPCQGMLRKFTGNRLVCFALEKRTGEIWNVNITFLFKYIRSIYIYIFILVS